MVMLNKRLVEQQDLKPFEIEKLHELHETKEQLFKIMQYLDPKLGPDCQTLRIYVKLLESLEYDMQRVWKFPQDKTRHTWWNRAPHCNCRQTAEGFKMLGFKGRVINDKCPLHGEQE